MPRLVPNGDGEVFVKLTIRETATIVVIGMIIVASVWGPLFLAWQDFMLRANAVRKDWVTDVLRLDDKLDILQRRMDQQRYDICQEHYKRCDPAVKID